jgi:hypothetical protein
MKNQFKLCHKNSSLDLDNLRYVIVSLYLPYPAVGFFVSIVVAKNIFNLFFFMFWILNVFDT